MSLLFSAAVLLFIKEGWLGYSSGSRMFQKKLPAEISQCLRYFEELKNMPWLLC